MHFNFSFDSHTNDDIDFEATLRRQFFFTIFSFSFVVQKKKPFFYVQKIDFFFAEKVNVFALENGMKKICDV